MDINVSNAISSIEGCLRQANNHYYKGCFGYEKDVFNEDHAIAEYYVERAFVEILVLVDQLSLQNTYKKIDANFTLAQKSGFLKSAMGIDDPYLVWCEKIRMFLDGISGAHGLGETATSELRDIKDILRRALYVICDPTLFNKVPQKESEVHDRLEAILKCSFMDVKRKPSISKSIKNFEPDTGIVSARTLIEYKYIANNSDAKRVADEILADTRGYKSRDWMNLLFVIYESHRVKPEKEWSKLLEQCEVGCNCDVIVLSGG